jgi:hypothetical protein
VLKAVRQVLNSQDGWRRCNAPAGATQVPVRRLQKTLEELHQAGKADDEKGDGTDKGPTAADGMVVHVSLLQNVCVVFATGHKNLRLGPPLCPGQVARISVALSEKLGCRKKGSRAFSWIVTEITVRRAFCQKGWSRLPKSGAMTGRP